MHLGLQCCLLMVSLPLICVSQNLGASSCQYFICWHLEALPTIFFFFFFWGGGGGGGVLVVWKYYLFYCTATDRVVIISDAMHNNSNSILNVLHSTL